MSETGRPLTVYVDDLAQIAGLHIPCLPADVAEKKLVAALKNGGVITCCISAGQSEVYGEGVPFFNNQPVYKDITEMGSKIIPVEESPFHYVLRGYLGVAMQQIKDGADIDTALQEAQDATVFYMEGMGY